MIKFQSAAAAIVGLALGAILWSNAASAITIAPNQSAGFIPTAAGTGLAATYYKFSQAISTLAQGDTLVAGASGPTASFTALTVCFPSCNGSATDGNSLASYISPNGTNLVGSSVLGQAVTRYNGYIAIATAASYNFGLFSDDGASLAIGGTSIINNDGLHGVTGSTVAVIFQSPGLYRFYVDHFENGGGTGVTVLENSVTIATSNLYDPSVSVPEPTSLALLGAGLAAVGAARRRRRTVSPPKD